MINETYPHNRLQRKIENRKKRFNILHIIWIVVIGFAVFLTKPSYAGAATIEYNKTGAIDGTTLFSTADFNTSGARGVKFTTTGSGLSDVTNISIDLLRDMTVPDGNVCVDIYEGGSDMTSSVFLITTNCIVASTITTGGAYVDFSVSAFDMQPNTNYWFHIYRTSAALGATRIRYWAAPAEADVMVNDCCGWGPFGVYARTRATGSSFLYDATTSLTPSFGPYITGSPVNFHLVWEDVSFTVYNIFFYSDVEETEPVRVTEDTPFFDLGGGANWDFSYTYNFAGTYNPIAILGNEDCTDVDENGTPIGSGCEYEIVQSDTVLEVLDPYTANNQADIDFAGTFTASKYNEVLVNENILFTYAVNANTCTGSSISGKRMFLDYQQPYAPLFDSGSILPSGLTGSLVRSYKARNTNTDFYYPIIRTFCANGTSKDMYLGGSVVKGRAIGISVYNSNDIRFALPDAWLNGGAQDGFEFTGSGAYFASDKNVYQRGEPVKLRWQFDVGFTVNKVELYTDVGSPLLRTFSGSTDITEDKNHYTTITYIATGEYDPYIRICSTSCSQFRIVHLGGTDNPSPYYKIIITEKPSSIYINSGGTILGTFSGTGGRINAAGIFQFDVMNFTGFGPTGNVFIDAGQSVLVVAIQAGIWVAEKLWSLLSVSAFYTWLLEILHPVSGATYVIPSNIVCFSSSNCIAAPAGVAGTQFTVHYANYPNSGNITKVIQALFSIALIMWVASHFMFHKKNG